ncbi:poly-gamma-glutamate biosynthesis protein PgsC/CapC [Phycicoccus flavus]|uniref:poly-gamma-glutamate biosynthesis protein PgsC/CapC n=1 Tax=Phycicoccus flavus TaxID=2502783 RepID=UPI000FEBC74A|nr:poly-gamma-glutamate biosynthesis protein PgsC/CapC [Phycicoccus flavus]NHA68488.1 hypothetical protein [Phycicoccus flavus]
MTFTPEVMRITLVVGVILGMLFYERFQLTTGGAIVPPYLALAVSSPLSVLVTLTSGYLTYLVVARVVSRRVILYGRRKFEVELVVGLGFVLLFTGLAALLGRLDPAFAALAGVGFLVPGLIAHDMSRQQPKRTLLAIGVTAVGLFLFAVVLDAVFEVVAPPHEGAVGDLSSTTGFPPGMLVVAVTASVLVGILAFSRFGVRSGGFITGAYVALVSTRWYDLVFIAVVAVLTWVVVVHVMMPRLLVFGRRKLATMLLVGAVIGWTLEGLVVERTGGSYVPMLGMTIATLMVPALVANDAQRQGWERTAWGVAISATGVVAVANLVFSGLGWAGVTA